MQLLTELPKTNRATPKLPDELFDGQIRAVSPAEFDLKSTTALRARLRRERAAYPNVTKMVTRVIDEKTIAVQAVLSSKGRTRRA